MQKYLKNYDILGGWNQARQQYKSLMMHVFGLNTWLNKMINHMLHTYLCTKYNDVWHIHVFIANIGVVQMYMNE